MVENPIVYPADVYYYGRKSLGVFEQMASLKYRENHSWKIIGTIVYEKYEICLNSIKAAIKRLDLVFNRLLTAGIISVFQSISQWLCVEERGFQTLSLAYRRRLD